MRRYRNARYAPEALERKLSPSGLGLSAASVPAPAPAQYSTMSAYSMPSPTYYSNSSNDDYLAGGDDGTDPPPPGEGPAPTVPPQNPTGPVLPG